MNLIKITSMVKKNKTLLIDNQSFILGIYHL